MTLIEFNEMLTSVETEQQRLFELATSMYAQESTTEEYAKVGISFNRGLFHTVTVISEDINDMDIQDVIAELNKFTEEHALCTKPNKSAIELDADCSAYDYSASIDSIEYSYTFSEINQKIEATYITQLKRDAVSKALKPANANYAKPPDCKVVQLFKDGLIDWDTLQKITYKDCDI